VRITARSSIDAYAFFDLFTDASMLNQVEAYLGCIVSDCFRRLRNMFLARARSVDRSCQQAVNAFAG
jgi:hypothetical protein